MGQITRRAARRALEAGVNTKGGPSGNVAVLLRGPIPAAAQTAAALLRHVVSPVDAAIFYVGSNSGAGCEWNTDALPENAARSIYGPALKGFATDPPVATRTVMNDAASALLADLSRIETAYAMLRGHEKQRGLGFDQVLITRADLVLYSKPDLTVSPGEVHIVVGSGFDTVTGAFVARNSPVLPYRDPSTGDLTPVRPGGTFTDRVLVVSGPDLHLLADLSSRAHACLRRGAPAHIETMLYLLLVARGGLQIVEQPDWRCETLRSGGARPVTFHDLAAYRRADLSDAVAITRGLRPFRDERDPETKPQARPRVAVLLYGLLREYKRTASSLLKQVVEPNDASIFYFGPRETDVVTRAHDRGVRDDQGFFLANPKGEFTSLVPLADIDLTDIYGARLAAARFHDRSQQAFLNTASEICSPNDWLFMLSPHRLLSMFYNITGVIELLYEHERATGEVFDEVIITRPDLAFYAPVSPEMKTGEVHIPFGEGFDENGNAHRGNAPAYFYKNVAWGSYVPAGREATFNDQVIALRREDLRFVRHLYDQLVRALAARIPASPETILYLLLVKEAGLKPVYHPDWTYEIFRADDPVFKSVLDTPDLAGIDPHHPRMARRTAEAARLASEERERAGHEANQRVARRDDQVAQQTALLGRILEKEKADGLGSAWRGGRARWLLGRARRARRRGRLAEAERLYARYLRLAPLRQREWVQYGHVLKDNGHRDAALVAYRMALSLRADPDAILHHDALVRDLERS